MLEDDGAQAAVMGLDQGGRVTLWSPGAERLYEVPEGAAMGERIVGLAQWHGRFDSAYAAAFEAVGLNGYWTFYNRVTTRGGHELSLRSMATVACGPQGAREMLVTSSPCERSGEDVAGSGPALRLLLGNPSLVTVFFDEHQVVGYVNSRVQSMIGYLAREVLGRPAGVFIHPDDRSTWQDAWDWALEHPAQYRALSYRVRAGDGDWRWVEGSVINMLDEASVGAVALSVRDVTDERLALSALSAAERTLRTVLESSLEGVWVIGRDGETVLINDRMRELLELRYPSATGAPAERVLDESLLNTLRERVREATPGAHNRYEVSYSGADGAVRWLRLAVVPSYDRAADHVASVVLCSETGEHGRLGPDVPLGHLLGLSRPKAAETSYIEGLSSLPALGRLSQRELDIVIRLLLGDRVPKIAQKLFVSQSTVRNQLSSVFRKLGVGSQQELIALLRDKLSTH